jgi:hypothetical protein
LVDDGQASSLLKFDGMQTAQNEAAQFEEVQLQIFAFDAHHLLIHLPGSRCASRCSALKLL